MRPRNVVTIVQVIRRLEKDLTGAVPQTIRGDLQKCSAVALEKCFLGSKF